MYYGSRRENYSKSRREDCIPNLGSLTRRGVVLRKVGGTPEAAAGVAGFLQRWLGASQGRDCGSGACDDHWKY